MSKVKVSFSVSIDGFGAAPQPSLENPMGVGAEALAEWAFATRTFQRMDGKDGTEQIAKWANAINNKGGAVGYLRS